MLKSFNYRRSPTTRQQQRLSEQWEEGRWLWNTFLAARTQAWEERQETVDEYEQKAALPGLKAEVRPGLKEVHSPVVQDVALEEGDGRLLSPAQDRSDPRLSALSRHGAA